MTGGHASKSPPEIVRNHRSYGCSNATGRRIQLFASLYGCVMTPFRSLPSKQTRFLSGKGQDGSAAGALACPDNVGQGQYNGIGCVQVRARRQSPVDPASSLTSVTSRTLPTTIDPLSVCLARLGLTSVQIRALWHGGRNRYASSTSLHAQRGGGAARAVSQPNL